MYLALTCNIEAGREYTEVKIGFYFVCHYRHYTDNLTQLKSLHYIT